MLSVDTTNLTKLIKTCFDLSMDGRFSDQQQTAFLVVGKQLRGSLLNLLSAHFNDGTQEVVRANQELDQVNQRVAQLQNDLSKTASVLNQVNGLVGVLDGLLKLAATFV